MLQKPVMRTIRTTALVLLPIVCLGYWFWEMQRNYEFVRAASMGNISEVRAMLDRGIDPNKAEMKGAKALPCAIDANRPQRSAMVRLLLDRGADPNDGLYMAIACERADIVQLLIARGANVNRRLCCGDGSLLLLAAQTKNNKIIHLLKAAGARK